MPRMSAALLPYRRCDGRLEDFLVHSASAPFWANKDTHAWSVAKGEVERDEDLKKRRTVSSSRRPVSSLRGLHCRSLPHDRKTGKLVRAWAIEADIDPSVVRIKLVSSWNGHPDRVGLREFPDIYWAAWFELAEARSKTSKRDRSRSSANSNRGSGG